MVQSTRPVLTFVTAKTRKLYLRKKNPRVIRWTVTYRKLNKKTATVEEIRKRNKKSKKILRPIAGADLETIRQKKAQRDTIREASREAALKELEARKVKFWFCWTAFFNFLLQGEESGGKDRRQGCEEGCPKIQASGPQDAQDLCEERRSLVSSRNCRLPSTCASLSFISAYCATNFQESIAQN